MTLSHPLVLRRDAAQATQDRFLGRLHKWGEVDCCRIVAFHVRKLGYKPNLASFGTYSSERGAIRALLRQGFASPGEALVAGGLTELRGEDGRVAYAQALVGDIIGLRAASGDWPALAVLMSNGRVLTSTPDHPAYGLVTPGHDDIVACWRADPMAHRVYARYR